MNISKSSKFLIPALIILILFTVVYLETQTPDQENTKVDANLIVSPTVNPIETTPTIIENRENETKPSCMDIPISTNPYAGITYLESYCMGDYCMPQSTKPDCEAVDVVTISNNKLDPSWGKDNIADCVWTESPIKTIPSCNIKYY